MAVVDPVCAPSQPCESGAAGDAYLEIVNVRRFERRVRGLIMAAVLVERGIGQGSAPPFAVLCEGFCGARLDRGTASGSRASVLDFGISRRLDCGRDCEIDFIDQTRDSQELACLSIGRLRRCPFTLFLRCGPSSANRGGRALLRRPNAPGSSRARRRGPQTRRARCRRGFPDGAKKPESNCRGKESGRPTGG